MKYTVSDLQNIVRKISPGCSITFNRNDLDTPPMDFLSFLNTSSEKASEFPNKVLEGLSNLNFYWVPRLSGFEFRRLPQEYPDNYRSWVSEDEIKNYEGYPGKYWLKGQSWFDQSSKSLSDRFYYRMEDVRKDFPLGLSCF